LAADARPLDRRVVITALGIAQILAWGTSFYFPAVFAEPIVKETGWSLGALLLEAKGAQPTIGVLTIFALINVLLIGSLWRLCRKPA
jgi:hypothetical protein